MAQLYVVWPFESVGSEVDSSESHVKLEGQEHAPTKLLLGEQLGVLQKVLVNDLFAHLLVIFDVDALVLEHAVRHLHVVQQTVLGVVIIEQWVLVNDWLALPRNVFVVFGPSRSARVAHDALA